MQPSSSNGVPATPREMLDSVRQAIEKLEAELRQQQEENARLKQERDEYRKMLVDWAKPQLLSRAEWEDFDPKDYTLTIDEIIADINAK